MGLRMDFNILITSVSRKVWLVKAFKDAFNQEKIDGKVMSVDINALSAGFYASDKHQLVPLSSDPKFIPTLLKICEKENVRLLIPTRDDELALFAKNNEKFENKGVKVMISDLETIRICNDKYKFYQFLTENNFPTPKTYLSNQIILSSISYPLIIKSRLGSGGKNIFKVKNESELNFFLNYVPDPIVQEFIDGKEYTIDLFSDFNKNVLTVVPRERIETFCGESYKGRTVEDNEMIEKAKSLAETLGTIGHITIQCIKNDGGMKFIEINPRFGGGANLGFASGANTPIMLLKLLLGKDVKPSIEKYNKNLTMLRYTEDYLI